MTLLYQWVLFWGALALLYVAGLGAVVLLGWLGALGRLTASGDGRERGRSALSGHAVAEEVDTWLRRQRPPRPPGTR